MPADPARFTLSVDAGPDADQEERLELARRLRQELIVLSQVDSME